MSSHGRCSTIWYAGKCKLVKLGRVGDAERCPFLFMTTNCRDSRKSMGFPEEHPCRRHQMAWVHREDVHPSHGTSGCSSGSLYISHVDSSRRIGDSPRMTASMAEFLRNQKRTGTCSSWLGNGVGYEKRDTRFRVSLSWRVGEFGYSASAISAARLSSIMRNSI